MSKAEKEYKNLNVNATNKNMVYIVCSNRIDEQNDYINWKVKEVSNKTAGDVEKGWKKSFAGMKEGFAKASKQIQKGQQQIKSGAMTVAAGVGMVAPLALAAKSAATFQEGMAEVATLTKKSAKEITEEFGPIVNATRQTFGKEAQGTIKALYDGFSAGVPKTKAAASEYLKATGQMALGGKTDMGSAADAITTVKNAWKFEGLSFQQIVDQTFAGVQEGKTTVTELAASMGQAASTVAGARIPYAEFIGATAALTAAGVKTPQAMTQITASIAAIQKPSSEAAKMYKKIGAEINPLIFKTKGYAGTIDYIRDKVNAHTKSETERAEIFNSLIGSVEAGRAVFALAGDQNEKFKESIDAARLSTGLMGEAADKMREGPMFAYKQAIQDTQIAWEEFGSVTAPILVDLLGYMKPLVRDTAEWIRENEAMVKMMAEVVLWVGAATVALGFFKAAVGIATVIQGLTTALWTMNVALYANPMVAIVIAVITAIALYGIYIHRWITQTEEMAAIHKGALLEIKLQFLELRQSVYDTIDDIVNKWRWFTSMGGEYEVSDWGKEAGQDVDRVKKELDLTIEAQYNAAKYRSTQEKKGMTGSLGRSGGGGTLHMGGITNNFNIPDGGTPLEMKNIKSKIQSQIKEAAKQAAREMIGK